MLPPADHAKAHQTDTKEHDRLRNPLFIPARARVRAGRALHPRRREAQAGTLYIIGLHCAGHRCGRNHVTRDDGAGRCRCIYPDLIHTPFYRHIGGRQIAEVGQIRGVYVLAFK